MDYIYSHSYARPFYAIPMFATHLELSPYALVLYARLYTRCLMSRKNGLIDEESRVYCFYSVDNMAADMKCSRRTVQTALKALENNDLIERHRKGPKNNRIYVKHTIAGHGDKITAEEYESIISQAFEREEVLRAKEHWEALHGKFVFPDFKAKEKALPS